MGQPGMPYATAWGVYQTFLTPTDQTPLTVSSTLPLEVVMKLFKRMGYVRHVFASFEGISHCLSISPRVILVEDFGTLVGLTTVKDVLHLEPHGQLNSPMIAWRNRGALDGALEELWTWLADVRSSVNAWYSRVVSRWLR
jgi:chloride channel 3/4/5